MTSLASNEVAEYARAVRAALSDLPIDSARAILDGLDEHLAEVAAEGSVDLDATLGPPAAYAAELRASAGLPAVPPGDEPVVAVGEHADQAGIEAPDGSSATVFEPNDPVATDRPQAEPTAVGGVAGSRRIGGAHDVAVARGLLVVALALVAVVVIRASEPLGALEIIAITAGVAGAWWVIAKAGRRAELTGWWERRFPAVVTVVAVAAATWLGGQVGGGSTEYVYTNDPYSVASTVPPDYAGVADVIGLPVVEARNVLWAQGSAVRTIDAATGIELMLEDEQIAQFAVVVLMDPPPGTAFQPGVMITLGVSMADGTPIGPFVSSPLFATTTVSPETTLPPLPPPTSAAVRQDDGAATTSSP